MDLTNIKPCVECKKRVECIRHCSEANVPRIMVRMNCIIVLGEDCFEESER